MSNFAFLPPAFRAIQASAIKAEGHIWGDPRAACFHARFTLEAIVHWLDRHDRDRLGLGLDRRFARRSSPVVERPRHVQPG